jgi:hypothetical protein
MLRDGRVWLLTLSFTIFTSVGILQSYMSLFLVSLGACRRAQLRVVRLRVARLRVVRPPRVAALSERSRCVWACSAASAHLHPL